MKGLLFFLPLIYSSGSVRKLDFYETDSIGADYNKTKPITFKSTIPMKFFANANGKEIDLSNR